MGGVAGGPCQFNHLQKIQITDSQSMLNHLSTRLALQKFLEKFLAVTRRGFSFQNFNSQTNPDLLSSHRALVTGWCFAPFKINKVFQN